MFQDSMTILMIGVIFYWMWPFGGRLLEMQILQFLFFCFPQKISLSQFCILVFLVFFRRLSFLLCTENFPVCLQAMYNEFSTANIQIDKDFSAKLSGYGCVGHIPEADVCSSSVVSALNSYEDSSIIVLVSDCKILLFLYMEMEWYNHDK